MPSPRVPSTDRILRSASKKKPEVDTPEPLASTAAPAKKGELATSMKIYAGCVGTLVVVMSVLVRVRPAAPGGGVCDGVGPASLMPPPLGHMSTASVKELWTCTKAYQDKNWWFVLAFFYTLYVGLKMLAIPATFGLIILSGALFPLPLSQVVTGLGEAVGSSLCYLLSRAFLAPIIEHFFSAQLEKMRTKAAEEARYMLSFNFFLRLTPFMPNWMINLSCPLVGIPLLPFFIGSLFGTQLSLAFLALSGATLRQGAETGFDLDVVKGQVKKMAALMVVVQCVPIGFIYLQKKRHAASQAKAQ